MAQVRKYQEGGKSWFIKNGVKQEFNKSLYDQLFSSAESLADPEDQARAKMVLNKGLKEGSTIYYDDNNVPYVIEADGTRTDFYENKDKMTHRSKAQEFFGGLVNSRNNRAALAADQVFNGRIISPQSDEAKIPEKNKIDVGTQLYLPIVGEGENAYYNLEGVDYLKALERLNTLKQSLSEEGWNDKNEFIGNDDIPYYLKNKQNVEQEIDSLITLFNSPEALKALTSTSKEALRLKNYGINLGNIPKKGETVEMLGDAAAARDTAKTVEIPTKTKTTITPAPSNQKQAVDQLNIPEDTFITRGNYYSPHMQEVGLNLKDGDYDREVAGYQYADLGDGTLMYRTLDKDGKYLYAIGQKGENNKTNWLTTKNGNSFGNISNEDLQKILNAQKLSKDEFKDWFDAVEWTDDKLTNLNDYYEINGQKYYKKKSGNTKNDPVNGNGARFFEQVYDPKTKKEFIIDTNTGKAFNTLVFGRNGVYSDPRLVDAYKKNNLIEYLSQLTPDEYNKLKRYFNISTKKSQSEETPKKRNGGILKAELGTPIPTPTKSPAIKNKENNNETPEHRAQGNNIFAKLANNLKSLTSPERQLQWMDRMQAWKYAGESGNVQRNGIREANEIGKMAGMPAQTQIGPFNAAGYHAQNNAIDTQLAGTTNQLDTITDNSLRVNALLGASNAAIQAKGQNNLNLDSAYSQYGSQVDAAKNQDNQMRYNVARGYADGNKQTHLGMMDATLKEINNKSTILDTALREDIQGFRGDKALRANAVFSPQDNYELQQLLLAERKGDFKITDNTPPEQIVQIKDKLARLNDLKERSNKAYIMQLSMPTYINMG